MVSGGGKAAKPPRKRNTQKEAVEYCGFYRYCVGKRGKEKEERGVSESQDERRLTKHGMWKREIGHQDVEITGAASADVA